MESQTPLQALNPFMPGAGLQPPALVGRTGELELMDRMAARTKLRLLNRGIMLYGLRGIGKTVLLLRMRSIAEQRHMATIKIEASADAGKTYDALFREIPMSIARIGKPDLREKVGGVFSHVESISFDFMGVKAGADFKGKESFRTESYRLQLLIEGICRELRKADSGLYLFVDELQEMNDGPLGDLITIQHEMGQQNLPFYIIGAGLPDLPGVLAKSRSYAERLFEYREIDKLDDISTRKGFQEPARNSGRPFSDDSLSQLVDLSQGYPYFIQAYGAATWNASDSNPIGEDAVAKGKSEALRMLDHGLYMSRWQKATEAGRMYLRIMADLSDGPVRTADVARRFRSRGSAASARASLIADGLIYSAGYGQVAFSVPRMAEFVRRVMPEVEQPYDGRR
ncbi:ATP-binding protein [Bifidobacterium avesanii]|uniref:AAA family ATPase n=1 Tax=Bifidobacterium avesanii TaxID=1798157 RepID=A0A7K3TI02_9BIFI|nr:ATP-binding protein [Bifidobacterium avesanii]KAB8288238.1 hypothetical protein DSM100685_1768 [Bifidobacterium avesanii]NEG78725.1 AAA family ATPase [Bifidobacterium avesanii]